MIDPSDTVLKIFEEGDEGILPTPTGGEFGEQVYANYHAVENNQPKIFVNYYYQLTSANNIVTPDANDRPDYWRVKLDQTAGCRINVYLGGFGQANGYPIPVETGETCIVPGTGTDWRITIVWVQGTTVNVTVMAERGFPGVLQAD